MKTIYLTSAYPDTGLPSFGPRWLMNKSDQEGLRVCARDPASADAILFVEGHPGDDAYFWKMLSHPLYQRYKSKSILYHDADSSVTLLPTISPSIEKWQFDSGWMRSAHYVARIVDNEAVENHCIHHSASRKYLASFLGSILTHPIREKIVKLASPDIYVAISGAKLVWEVTERQRGDFVSVSADSSFVLCPRGAGPGSYRLFEAMQMGRPPVIISDEWVEIEGIDWSAFSVRVPESQTGDLVSILKEAEPRSLEMGKTARLVWERYFSPASSLRTLAALSFELLAEPRVCNVAMKGMLQFTHPAHFRGLIRQLKREVINAGAKWKGMARARVQS